MLNLTDCLIIGVAAFLVVFVVIKIRRNFKQKKFCGQKSCNLCNKHGCGKSVDSESE